MTPVDFISEFSEVENPIKGVRLPELKIEDRHKKEAGVKSDCSNFDFLRALCKKGFSSLNLKKGSKEYDIYIDRIKTELNTINELGFTDYILLVWDVINFCHENSIPTGPGRGSAAGSLILFLIGITKINPIKYGLFFERFISKARAKKTVIDGVTYLDGSLLCDVDIDFDYYQRHKVIEYINNKYQGKTCKILTLNTLSSKLLIKEVGKILGMKSEDEMTHVTGLIPKVHGQVEDIEVAYNEVKDFKDWCDQNTLVYQTALKLKNLVKNKGVHPSGILISYEKLEDCCPIEFSSDKEDVSGYDMSWVSLFTVKLDALGLRSVSVVDDCCKSINIKSEDIDINNPSIYLPLQDLKYPHGLFQIEADVNYKVTQKVKPKNIDELAAVLSLGRPGAMQFTDKYANYTNTGTIDINTGSKTLDDILKETGGCCLFQETLMRACKEVFDLSLDEAEMVRRACGKKKKEDMMKFEKIIKEKAKQKNIESAGEFFWNLLLDSADYSFNKCVFEEERVQLENDEFVMLKDLKIGDIIKSYDVVNDNLIYVKIKDIMKNHKELYQIELFSGKKIRTSLDHKFLCSDKKMHPLREIISNNYKIAYVSNFKNTKIDYSKIRIVENIGFKPTIDLEVDHNDHNFLCEEMVVSNSHAAAYAALSAQTIYLKFNHTTQFYLSLLKMTKHEPDPIGEIAKISKEMSALGVELLPPSLTKSKMDFSIEDKNIRFGLSSIKGISEKTIEKINNFKREHSNKFELFQSAKEAGLSIGVLSALIQAGTLDSISKNRVLMVYEAQIWNLLTDREKKYVINYAKDYEDSVPKTLKALVEIIKDEKSKPIIKSSRLDTIKKNSEKYKSIYLQNKTSQDFANWWYENKLLGYTCNKRLIDIFLSKKESLEPIGDIRIKGSKVKCDFIGKLDEDAKSGKSKNGNPYAKFQISDETGILKVMIFSEKLEQCKALNNGLPKEGDIVIVCGTKMDDDTVFADVIATQQNKIFTKLSELKDV